MTKQLTFSNITCLVLIIGCLILKGLGFDGTVETILVAAAAFFFGRMTPTVTPAPGAPPDGKTQ